MTRTKDMFKDTQVKLPTAYKIKWDILPTYLLSTASTLGTYGHSCRTNRAMQDFFVRGDLENSSNRVESEPPPLRSGAMHVE